MIINWYRKNAKPFLIKWLCKHEMLKTAVQVAYGIGNRIHWKNPKTINEKLQCLKLGEYYNNPLITQCCDKILVKQFIASESSKFSGGGAKLLKHTVYIQDRERLNGMSFQIVLFLNAIMAAGII